MECTINGLSDFIKASPVPCYTVLRIAKELEEHECKQLFENKIWELCPGERYFVVRGGTSVIAFSIPESGFAPLSIIASHTDSPGFRIKPISETSVQGKYTLLNTEGYGGMIMMSWLDRPLGIAGRVTVRTDRGLKIVPVCPDRDAAMIPSTAIHMNRQVNDGYKFNAQTDMQPMIGDGDMAEGLMSIISEEVGDGEIVSTDLFVYNRQEPRIWGRKSEYISAPRLDDLECVYTSLCAFLNSKCGSRINMFCAFDNEEVGSGTKQGADSTFMSDVIARIAAGLKADDEVLRSRLGSSFMISADNAHAMHPNHPEKSDAKNRPFMNEGIVIKYSANQKYTTDGISAAVFSEICRKAGVPFQTFANRSDMPGGSTLGNISNTHVSIPTVDIGIAQLAMHSAYETSGTMDVEYMYRAMKEFYETEIAATENGEILIGSELDG